MAAEGLELTPEQLDARERLTRLARRALPVLAAITLVATTVALTGGDDDAATAAAFGELDDTAAVPGVLPGESAPGVAAGGTAGGGTGTGTGGAATGGATGGAGAATGIARSGVACTAAGVRQVTWSRYAPLCRPVFSGNNGGATSPGVTGDSITFTYRRQNSSQAAAVRALAGEATPVDSEFLHDLQVYMNLFNQSYELYGRTAELAPFNGRGDYLTEDLGQGQQAANADGITARELGGFVDITFPSATSLFYSAALQSQGVIAYGFPLAPQRWYEQNSPWQYNVFLSGTAWARWASNLVCQRLAGDTAYFAGDPGLHDQQRVFGLVNVEFPTWAAATEEIRVGIESQCGVKMVHRASYAEDLGSMQQNGSSIAAQLKSAGVTTVICFCDPLMPIFLTDAASRQEYRPEWLFQNQYDPIAQVTDQSQFAHAIAPGPFSSPRAQSEAYAAYKLADPNGEPASIYFPAAYEMLLHAYGALQSAGPVLNPTTYRDGVFSMPPSDGAGEFSLWGSGPGHYTPITGLGVVWWDTQSRSPNGNLGTWRPCDEGTVYPLTNPEAWGRGRIRCFR